MRNETFKQSNLYFEKKLTVLIKLISDLNF